MVHIVRSLILIAALTVISLPTFSAVPADVIILGGGKAPGDAEKFKSSWQSIEPLLKSYGLEPYGKITESKSHKNLNPGFYIYIVGYCAPSKTKAVIQNLRGLYAGIYARRTEVDNADMLNICPKIDTLPPSSTRWSTGQSTMLVFSQGKTPLTQKPEPGPPCERQATNQYVVLSKGKRHILVDLVAITGDEMTSGYCDNGAPTNYTCTQNDIKVHANGLEFIRSCKAGFSEGEGSLLSADEHTMVTVKRNKLIVKTTRKNKMYDQ